MSLCKSDLAKLAEAWDVYVCTRIKLGPKIVKPIMCRN